MKRIHQIILTATALFFTITVAQATGVPSHRQAHQNTRISQGVASGELNRRETRQLKMQQKRVQCHKKAVKSDGVVTKREKRQLDSHQDRASMSIYNKKHNLR